MAEFHSWIEISKNALLHNYKLLSSLAKEHLFVPVLKGEAYGHGLAPVYEIIRSENPQWIGVNALFEAQMLRDLGYGGSILVMGPLLPGDLEQAGALRADIFLTQRELLESWLALDQRSRIHIKVDTGLSRQGFDPGELPYVFDRLKDVPKTSIFGLCTHYANVEDVSSLEYPKKQWDTLIGAHSLAQSFGLNLTLHANASASTLIMPRAGDHLCRVGISLYGFWPSSLTRLSYHAQNTQVLDLKPILSWKARLTQVRPIPARTKIGYGCTYESFQPMTIGVVSAGYFEGYPRLAGGRGSYVLIHGVRCPILGRLCMNMMIVDISHLREPKLGDIVTLIGKDGDETLRAEDIAQWAETIHYEITTRLPGHLPRVIR
jgi:alanine racemase